MSTLKVNGIRHSSGSSDAISLTSDGAVTKANQPAWSGNMSTAVTWSSGWTKLTINQSNYGSGFWDASNYRFVAPVTGIYAISMNCEFNIGSGQIWIYANPRINANDTTSTNAGIPFVDMSPTSGNSSNNSYNNYFSYNRTDFAKVTKDDYIEFWVSSSSGGNSFTVANSTQSAFAIQLLS